jgi:hypothetical protein
LEHSVCLMLITRNEPDKAGGLLQDIRGIVDEVVLIDSSDEPRHALLKSQLKDFEHVHVYRLPPLGIAEAYRQYALRKVCSEWTLLLDSDERLDGFLKQRLPQLVKEDGVNGYMILRQPVYIEEQQRRTVGANWYKTRLFRTRATRFYGLVHEQPKVSGKLQSLPQEYRMVHYVDVSSYWLKARRYIKLDLLLGRWCYNNYAVDSYLKRLLISAYVAITGKKLMDEVTGSDLLLFKRLASRGLKKFTYRPNEYLRRKLALINSLDTRSKRLSFDVWCDIMLFGGAIPYLGLDSDTIWGKLWDEYGQVGIGAEDFYMYKLVEKFYERHPNYSRHMDIKALLTVINRAADQVFPETRSTSDKQLGVLRPQVLSEMTE